jgi:hypothetical protein
MAECHPDRKHLAKGLCAACYQSQLARARGLPVQGKKHRMADCHPDRPHQAKGLCRACYIGQYAREHKDDPDKPYLGAAKRHEYYRAWYVKHPGRSHRRAAGVTQEVAERMLADQGGQCAICRRPALDGDAKWQVDHCHSTGQIRGILCHHCNLGIGHFNDDPAILARAIAYLQKWEA